MVALISLLIICICLIIALFMKDFISDTMEKQTGVRALNLAQSVANIPELIQAFNEDRPAETIQAIVSPIQKETGAEFIVVGNSDGIRYSHPRVELIGQEMVGDDNERALLNGESYVSRSEGTLGNSIRGKVPVVSDGEVVGVVSVGFLSTSLQENISSESRPLWLMLMLIALAGIGGAILIASYIKKLLNDMEPEEITHLYNQKETILESTREGIIATDKSGNISTINAAAKEILSMPTESADDYFGKTIKTLFTANTTQLNFLLGESFVDRETILGGNIVLLNKNPIGQGNVQTGYVYSFRKKTEVEKMTEELSRIRQYANAQRSQTHEHSNKLHIILGLLQNDEKAEAIDFIRKENNMQKNRLKFLGEHVSDPLVNALFQGKLNQANELGISLIIHPDSKLDTEINEKVQDALLTSLGNLIENAFEAVRNRAEHERKVSIFFTDIGDDIIFEIEDSGTGIASEDYPFLFEQGFSTKQGQHRGTGLALTKHALDSIEAEILLEEGDLGGACFTIIIPKDGEGHE